MLRWSLDKAALLFVAFCLWQGCATGAYSRARKAGTAEAYRAFLREHPRDGNAEEAHARLAELEFERARRLHTVLAYKRYLEEFPDSASSAAARALLEGLRFNAATEQGTAMALRGFLRDHPDGAHHDEARKLLAEAEYQEATEAGDPGALARVIAGHPEDPRRPQAEAQLDDRAFAEAKASGAFRLLRYLRDYPAGTHREEAKARLLALKLDGLLFSGLLDEARAEARRSPLSRLLEDLGPKLARADAERTLRADRQALVQAALAGNYLRSLEDLEKTLAAPDPLDRWQAAEELSQQVSVRAIDPLLRAFRTARNPLVRQKAFEGLRAVLRALPRPVAEYEVATRLEQLRALGPGEEVTLTIAALLDLSGRLAAAAAEYQKAFDARVPDPIILRRWAQIRLERRQPFSAAVAARQLALWAREVAREANLPARGAIPVALARHLCAAAEASRFAFEVISSARTEKTDFPEDLAQFEREAREARGLAEARLADAELLLQTQDPLALRCGDRRVADRLAAALQDRRRALREVPRVLPGQAPELLRLVSEKDPSFEIRAQAAALLASLPRRSG